MALCRGQGSGFAALSRGRAAPGPPVMWGHSVPHTPRGTLSVEKEFPESQAGETPAAPCRPAYLPVRGTSSAWKCSGRPKPFGSDARQCSALAERTCWSFYPSTAGRDPPTAKIQRRTKESPRPHTRIKIPSRGTNVDDRCASSVGPAREGSVPCGFPPLPGSSGENKKRPRLRPKRDMCLHCA